MLTLTLSPLDISDGWPLPVLPGRMHLTQSRFAVLKDKARQELKFNDLAKDDDPTRIDEQMVVTIDAQLFYSVLAALPYLVDYPYECIEQTLNRFLSTGIVASLFCLGLLLILLFGYALSLDVENVETISGFILNLLGSLPKEKEEVKYQNYKFT